VKNARTETEIADALADVQTSLDVVVEHLELREKVRSALQASHAKAERSRHEIERSLGHGTDVNPSSGEDR
jgi:queuine/archaeosine tRNA-ribosyltransferase